MRATTRSCFVAAILLSAIPPAAAGKAKVDITTYHYDNLRTGWNQRETVLTPKNVASKRFGLIASTVLDDQVDAQPLILSNQGVNGNSAREVVYIATEGDTVYAIDADTGDILLRRNLGTPVLRSTLPGQCTNGGPNLGINSTPVMDPETHTLYLIAYTTENHKPVYRVHALDPSTLADTVDPTIISAKGKLSDGSSYEFDPHESRQRAGLLLANGTIYAGFASFCDYDANQSRGWMLGWKAKTLKALRGGDLTDKLAHSTNDFFLSAVWMSGYAPAASTSGDFYFITGNSDYAGNSFDPVQNIAESVVQMKPDLSVDHLFTPTGGTTGWQTLDQEDGDFGSGGFMLLPPQSGQPTDLGVAAGKNGVEYVFNADDVSNGQGNGGQTYSSVQIGGCWCGPSYYMGSDGVGRVVSSGATTAKTWKVQATGTPSLVFERDLGTVDDVFFPGFFTSVSSNGTMPATTVVWAMGRPADFGQEVLKLHAYDAEKGGEIFATDAGYWTNSLGDSNTVPVVANGKVYIATVQSLTIYGLKKKGAPEVKMPPPPQIVDTRPPLGPGEHEIRATVVSIQGYTLVVKTRDGQTVTIDSAPAAADHKVAPPSVGHALVARGAYVGDVLKAELVGHASDHPAMWPKDR
jgi:hypothetical protein